MVEARYHLHKVSLHSLRVILAGEWHAQLVPESLSLAQNSLTEIQ